MIDRLHSWWRELRIERLTVMERCLLLAPVAIWFSYYPTIHFARASATNIEVSLAVVYIIILALLGIPHIIQHWRKLLRQPVVWLTGAVIVWICLSVAWSANPLRGILTAGMWVVLFLVMLSVMTIAHRRILLAKILDVYIATSVVMALFALLQVMYGVWFDWGLCAGCVASNFGFVRSNGFAIEPQFFGSMFIAPIIIAAWRLMVRRQRKYDGVFLGLFITALYVTLSRGAALAVVIAIMTLIAINIITTREKKGIVSVITISAIAVIAGMVWHGTWTQLNPKVADTFYDAIAKSVNQMSLGVISLPKGNTPLPTATASDNMPPPAKYDGLVEESTTHRTSLSIRALNTWRRDPVTILIGVGIGGAGQAMYEQDKQLGWPMEIVQNEYIERLLEGGVVGALLCVAAVMYIIWRTRSFPWAWAITAGYIVQWNFFSGLPNALHIYLVVVIIFATIVGSDDEKTTLSRRLYASASA